MPRLWNETIEAHRQDVRDAVVAAAAEIVAEQGLMSVTMSEVAVRAGIGRATLYKYFPDVEAILTAWHERQIAGHVRHLVEIRDRADADRRLEAVLEAFAMLMREPHGHDDAELSAVLHRDEQTVHARRQVKDLIRGLLAERTGDGSFGEGLSADEAAVYCVNALAAAREMPTKAAVRRLVAMVLAGLRPIGKTRPSRG